MKTKILVVIGCVAVVWLALVPDFDPARVMQWLSPSFTDADVEDVKAKITSLYAHREGVTVTEVNLVRESRRKLVGFVKTKSENSFLGNVEFLHSCTAIMSDSGDRKYGISCGAAELNIPDQPAPVPPVAESPKPTVDIDAQMKKAEEYWSKRQAAPAPPAEYVPPAGYELPQQ